MATGEVRDLRNETTPRFPADEPQLQRERVREEEISAEMVTGGSAVEAVGGIATVVLAIVGLAGIFPLYLTAVAAIVLGASLLLQGGAVAARFSRLLTATAGARMPAHDIGGGVSAGFLGGVAGIVLGILSLLLIYPQVLLPVTAIVFGAVLLMAFGSTARLNTFVIERCTAGNELARRVAGDMVLAANSAQALVGVAGIVLGIVGVVGVYPIILSLVAFLVLGVAVVLSGTAMSARMMSMWNR